MLITPTFLGRPDVRCFTAYVDERPVGVYRRIGFEVLTHYEIHRPPSL